MLSAARRVATRTRRGDARGNRGRAKVVFRRDWSCESPPTGRSSRSGTRFARLLPAGRTRRPPRAPRRCRMKARGDHAARPAGIPAHGGRGILHRRHRGGSRELAEPGASSPSVDQAASDIPADRDQRTDHRGRAADLARSRRLVTRASATTLTTSPRTRTGGRPSSASTGRGWCWPTSSSPTARPGIDAVNDILGSLRRAGDLHHRLPRAAADRRAAGADLPDHQAVPAGDGEGGDQPGAVLRTTRPGAPKPALPRKSRSKGCRRAYKGSPAALCLRLAEDET